MSKFFQTGPIRTERGTFVVGTPFNFGPTPGTNFQLLVYSLTWSGLTTSSSRDAFELYSVLGGFTQLDSRYHLAQSGFGNLQQPVGFLALEPGCRGRVIATLAGAPPTFDVNVAYRIVRVGSI